MRTAKQTAGWSRVVVGLAALALGLAGCSTAGRQIAHPPKGPLGFVDSPPTTLGANFEDRSTHLTSDGFTTTTSGQLAPPSSNETVITGAPPPTLGPTPTVRRTTTTAAVIEVIATQTAGVSDAPATQVAPIPPAPGSPQTTLPTPAPQPNQSLTVATDTPATRVPDTEATTETGPSTDDRSTQPSSIVGETTPDHGSP